MTPYRLPDRYRFGLKYHLRIGLLTIAVLLVYWFGVVVPAHEAHRHDIWIMVAHLTAIFYVNFLKVWPWVVKGESLRGWRIFAVVAINMLLAIGASILISMAFGGLTVDFTGSGLKNLLTLFDGSVPNFYAFVVLPPLAVLALSYVAFYIEWTHGPFANRKNWQKQLMDLRMAWRRAQLDPHLLDFHLVVLSMVARQSKAKAQKALDYTIKVVHFRIGGNDPAEQIRLVDEIEAVRCLQEIQRIRFDNRLSWELRIGSGLEDIDIIAMTAMVVAENQVRYAVLDRPSDPAVLEVRLNGRDLTIHARNRKLNVKARHGSGTGLANLEERLAYAYPNRYLLDYNTTEDWYEMRLIIYGVLS